MRTTGYLGTTFVLAGCLLVLASTGALDVTVAERGMAVDTASDQNAFLGLDYAGMEDVELEPSDGPSCEGAFPRSCYHENVELVQFENNTDGNLNISQINIVENGNLETNNDAFDGITYEAGPPGIGRVVGDFECPAEIAGVSWFPPPPSFEYEQQIATSTVEIDLVASGDNLTVDLSRSTPVNCVSGEVQ